MKAPSSICGPVTYAEVASELDAFRIELLDATIQIRKESTVGDDVVNMHLCQPSLQGCIVDVVTVYPLVPTIPVAKSELANTWTSPPPVICAKSFVPRRKITETSSWLPMPEKDVVYS